MINKIVTSKNYNEEAYILSNPDVADAVNKGLFKNGREHFDIFGSKENRTMYVKKYISNKSITNPKKNISNSILDYYVLKKPNNQNLLDLFSGEWSSSLPISSGLKTKPGTANLFEDKRVIWVKEIFGDFNNIKILELGPLEGGHTYMLQNFGAKKIISVEANSKAFLKCLCIKEIFKLNHVEFKLGDFLQFLRLDKSKYDLVFASGILYHMENPIELLKLMSKVSNKIFIWTHYFDNNIISHNINLSYKFGPLMKGDFEGITYKYSIQSYKNALNWSGFCGGPAKTSKWLTRESILKILEHLGYKKIVINFDDQNHPNGPSFAICAEK